MCVCVVVRPSNIHQRWEFTSHLFYGFNSSPGSGAVIAVLSSNNSLDTSTRQGHLCVTLNATPPGNERKIARRAIRTTAVIVVEGSITF